jgi:flagellar biosynthesis/type III secretory pathway M-ring protein FliF/YscJ
MKTPLTVISIIFVIAMISLIIFKIIKNLRSTMIAKARLLDLEKSLANLKVTFNDDSQYMRFSKFMLLKEELAELKKQIQESRAFSLRKKIKQLLSEIERISILSLLM